MEPVKNLHDIFFKTVFTQPNVAQDFLKRYLPASIVPLLDWETLTLTEKSFVDSLMKKHFSDLLFTVQAKNQAEVRIYLLFEHKSNLYLQVAYQLFRYINRVWERDQRKKKGALPLAPVLPIVLHHGKNKWNISTHFSALLPDIEELKPYQPQFQYILVDLHQLSKEDITGEPLLQAALHLMKYSHSPQLADEAVSILDQFAERFEEQYGEIAQSLQHFNDLVESLVIYAINGTDKIHYNDLLEEIDQTLQKRGSHIMPTIADRLRQEGRKEGRQEGKQEGIEIGIEKGIVKAILHLLENRFGSVSYEIREKLEMIADEGELLSLQKSAIFASTMEEFRQHLP